MTMLKQVGKYQILEKIGAGGFGAVFKGRDPFIKRIVAIKTCQSDEEEIRKRFFREAEYAGNLQHRNITTIFDFGVAEDGLPYIVQEFLTGEDLDRRIKRRDATPLAEKLRILADVCDGLSQAHASGIIHRDIKPGNIRILDDGTVKIMDFGIAKSLSSESTLTQTGITLGTASYLAPEQIRGEQVSAQTDIFSFGVMSYEFLTLQRPFSGEQIAAVLHKILNEMPPRPGDSVPGIPVALDELILSTLAKDPAGRPRSCSEVRERLHEIIRDLTGAAPSYAGSSTQVSGAASTGREGTGRSAAIPPSSSMPLVAERSEAKSQKPSFQDYETGQTRRERTGEIPSKSVANVPLKHSSARVPTEPPSAEVVHEPEGRGGAAKILFAALAILVVGAGIAYFLVFRPPSPGTDPGSTDAQPSPPVVATAPAATTTEVPASVEPTAAPTAATVAKVPTPPPPPTSGSAFLRPSHFSELTLNGASKGGVSPSGLRLSNLPPGTYRATFSIKDFMSIDREFEVKAGKVAEVRVDFPGRGQLMIQVVKRLSGRTSRPGAIASRFGLKGMAPRAGRSRFQRTIASRSTSPSRNRPDIPDIPDDRP
jgi:serine/threonine protein kinase